MLLAGGSRTVAAAAASATGRIASRRPPPSQAMARALASGAAGGKGGGPADWSEELEKRRRDRLSSRSEGERREADLRQDARREGGRYEQPRPKASPEEVAAATAAAAAEAEMEAEAREEVHRRAGEMKLFAYPSDRRFPWATAALLAASGGFTAAVGLYWNFYVCRATTVEELQPLLQAFGQVLRNSSAGQEDVYSGAVHRLLLASLLRAGEGPARTLADVAVLGCCGTLLERLHGPGPVLALALGSTVAGNAFAALAHKRTVVPPRLQEDGTLVAVPASPCVASTSAATVGIGLAAAFRYGRWAAWPGVPVPVFWLLAPLFVAEVSSALSYFRQLPPYLDAVAEGESAAAATQIVASTPTSEGIASAAPPPSAVPRALELAVAIAACEAIEDKAREGCQPPPQDVVMLRREFEQAAEQEPPQPPDGGFWADVGGFAGALIAVAVL